MSSTGFAVMLRLLFALAPALALAGPAAARVEVPIRSGILSDGARRYGVPLTIGSTPIEAGLDTGSTGLRVMPDTLGPADAGPPGRSDHYSYGSGVELRGASVRATVAIGGLSGTTTVQQVDGIGCTAAKHGCAAEKIPPARFGIQGDGLPGEGFKAILGTAMIDADVASPLGGIGARRWLIDLPRPGEAAGRLVLDPDDSDAAGFVALPILGRFADRKGGLHDAVAGCLIDDARRVSLCGAVVFDTGAPGIRVVSAKHSPAWPDGTAVTLALADGGTVHAVEHLVSGRKAHLSHLTFETDAAFTVPVIFAGPAPYVALSVLYDPAAKTVAVRPRTPLADGPTAALQ